MATESDAERLWTDCAQSIRDQVSDVVWRNTFSGARVKAFDQRSLVLVVPTKLQKARIERRYIGLLNTAVEDANPNVKVRIEIDPELAADLEGELDDEPSGDAPGSEPIPQVGHEPTGEPDAVAQNLTKLTFEQFVTGRSNQFSHAAARAVAEDPAGSYNPLFIYGDSGLGKTHLLRAIAHYVHQHFPRRKVRYVTSETFLNDFVRAIRDRTQHEFKEVYRNNDLLLVDDIQFIEGKDGLQEEFFHTFNDLLQHGAQIVLSSDRSPDAIATLEDRLRSRFKSGLITDIKRPDLVTRLAILEKKAESSPIPTPNDVLSFIAESITDSIRELEGALIKVTAFASITKQECSLQLARQVLADVITNSGKAPVTAARILDETSALFNIPLALITGGSRRRNLVDARQVAMYVIRTMTDLSYPEIGRAFDNRDHTTVIHAVRKIERQMTEKQEIYNYVQELQDRVSRST